MYQSAVPRCTTSGVSTDPAGAVPHPRHLVAQSACMREVLGQLDRIAAARATVLVQGESGTGKEVIAHAIHARSPRRDQPFVRLNCAALPEGMLESELFGHEKGAFTGAVRQHPGRFELAHGGSIFLDEVGAADAKVQLRLLRVLQEQEFERVGGTRTLQVDVRTIAATNVDVKKEVAEGRLREDLFYRLNVVPLRLPPLRERPDDIPLLIDHLLRLHARRNAAPVRVVDREVVERLRVYPWPGNIRELENTMERMAIFARNDQLRVADIPPEIAEWRHERELDAMNASSFQAARGLFERRFLCQALQRHGGVISQVARTIGMSRKNLYTKLDELEIDYGRFRR